MYETSSLHFFEMDVISTARPVVSRSVTFNHDLCNPVIHIDGVNEKPDESIVKTFCNISLNRFSKERTLGVASRKSRKLSVFASARES